MVMIRIGVRLRLVFVFIGSGLGLVLVLIGLQLGWGWKIAPVNAVIRHLTPTLSHHTLNDLLFPVPGPLLYIC